MSKSFKIRCPYCKQELDIPFELAGAAVNPCPLQTPRVSDQQFHRPLAYAQGIAPSFPP